MKITFTDKKEGKGEFMFILEHTDLVSYREKVIKNYQNHLDIKGFRKGKIPTDIVEKKVGALKLIEEAIESSLPDLLDKAVDEHNIEMYGKPDIRVTKLTLDTPVELTASFVQLPHVTLATYTGLNVEKKEVKANEDDVNRSLEEFRNMNAKETAVTRESKKGDKVHVDFEAFLDNVPLEGGKATNHQIHLGESGQMFIPGFEEQFLAVKPGDNKEFTLTFPKDYGRKELAGRQVDFKAKIHKVLNVEKPELTDDLAKKFGDFKSVDDLRKRLADNLLEEAKRKEDERFELSLINELIKKNSFDQIPQEMVNDEIDRMLAELESSVTRQGGKFEDYLTSIKKTKEDLKKEFQNRAVERIKTALLLREVSLKHELKATDKDIDEVISHEKQHHKGNAETLSQIDSPYYRRHVANVLTSQNVIHYLKEQNTPSNKK